MRDPEEWAITRIEGARFIPRAELAEKVDELTRAKAIVLYCRSGRRSALATELLLELGFTNVKSLEGGILAWADQVDPSIVKYAEIFPGGQIAGAVPGSRGQAFSIVS